MSPARRQLILPLLFAALAILAVEPIRSYDFFWHIATGRWITEHGALPRFDPFAVASDRIPWINGEWLWQIMASANYRAGGLITICLTRALETALIFIIGYAATRREDVDGVALLATVIAFAGAHDRLDARPSTAAALLLVAAIAAAEKLKGVSRVAAYALITAVWINVHPSAILAPVIALLLTRDLMTTAASGIALLVNPFGWRAIANPIQLTLYASSGEFVNAEWLPSPFALFPLLYITIAIALVVFVLAEEKRREIGRVALFALLGWLAVRHVRNQGLYFAAFPLLVVPGFRRSVPKPLLIAAAAAVVVCVRATTSYGVGVEEHRFPISTVISLMNSPFNRGNVYNPDQFGGYLIWSFYPQRRVLTDGRNEMYHTYIAEYARARLDSRAWHALLAKYHIDVAVDEYHPPLDIVNAATGQHTKRPASLAYFPPDQWAFIAFDDVSMVFVRRAAFTAADIARYELKGNRPDAVR